MLCTDGWCDDDAFGTEDICGKMEDGRWKMEDGRWKMEDDRLDEMLEEKKKEGGGGGGGGGRQVQRFRGWKL